MHRLENKDDLDSLLERIGDANSVMLGEASHGTTEFYRWRAEITRRLVTEKGFSFIAVEGDWPDCYRINRYIKGATDTGQSAHEVLYSFSRWPTWMWANADMVDLVEWLKSHNKNARDKVGFYGLDVYSLWESLEAVVRYLKKNYPKSVEAAIRAFRCFEPYGENVEEYARATAFVPDSCEDEVRDMLVELRKAAGGENDGNREAYFNAEQNAIVTANAERYYRIMMHGGAESWNLRDTHMMDALVRLMEFHGSGAKSIVWAHNTHVGDARATDMKRAGMVNLGQLARERAAKNDGVVLAGFGTYRGSVIAAKAWGEEMDIMPVPPAMEGSWDSFFHNTGAVNRLVTFDSGDDIPKIPKGQRAIGVVYNPSYERYGNYVETLLRERYDAFLFIDSTRVLRPLHMREPQSEEIPETFPTGL